MNVILSCVRLPALCLLLLSAPVLVRGEVLPLVNPGFESGTSGWAVSTSASVAQSLSAYASMGYWGLKIKDAAGADTYTVTSVSCTASPGSTYALTLWGRSLGNYASGIRAEVLFTDASGNSLTPGAVSGYAASYEISAIKWFEKRVLKGVAPAGTVYVRVRFTSLAGYGIGACVDDLELIREVPGETYPSKVSGWFNEIGANPRRGQPAPKIILKLDDLQVSGSGIDPDFTTVANYLQGLGVKASMGIVCSSLALNNATFENWIINRYNAGWLEFWHHGCLHTGAEFGSAPYTQQKASLTDGNTLALVRLGFPLESFGAPENAWNSTTRTVLAEDSDIKVWLYGDITHPSGKTVLMRAMSVNIEAPTFNPDYKTFIEGYVHNRGSDYFVLQGHPTHWIVGADETRFQQFKSIIGFLRRADTQAVFVFPTNMIP